MPHNKYLVTPSGTFVGGRGRVVLLYTGALLLSAVLGIGGIVLGTALDVMAIAAVGSVLSFFLFVGAVAAQWVFLLGGASSVARATEVLLSGDTVSPVAVCQTSLARVFRADIRTRALHVLGLVAEANGDFAEAADLFERALSAIPTMAASKWQRHARVLMLSHRAVALVALGRLDEADAVVRNASLIFPQTAPGALDMLTDDAAFGSLGVAAALRDLEPGRDARALLTLASATVLIARGLSREAIDLVDRERWIVDRGLTARERALVERIEQRGRARLGGTPLRAPGVANVGPTQDPASAAWADRVLAAVG